MTPMSIIPYPATTTQIGAQPEGIWDRREEPRGRSDLKLERAQERYRVYGT